MMNVRNLAALMALSSVAVLPACSWLGIGNNNRQSSARHSLQPELRRCADVTSDCSGARHPT